MSAIWRIAGRTLVPVPVAVLADPAIERRHRADRHRQLHPGVHGGDPVRAVRSARLPGEAQPLRVDFGTIREQVQRPAAERAAFVAEAADGDGSLCAEVDSLLRAHEEGSTFLKAPLDGPVEAPGAAGGEVDPEPQARTLPPADALPGDTILREIQHGGQGIVYEALQESTRRHVALKVLM
ncbi:MAG: hypothetical protein HY721_23725, partial [Planctomycetes bacterium]|nr:hypothetical protein [Planctomycetota bacterium]